jgi:hypothetical protein
VGEEVVAVVALRDNSRALHAHCTSQLARFKAPKEFISSNKSVGLATARRTIGGRKVRDVGGLDEHDDDVVNVFPGGEAAAGLDARRARRLLKGPESFRSGRSD